MTIAAKPRWRQVPIPWAICLLGLLAESYRDSDGTWQGTLNGAFATFTNPLGFLVFGPFPTLMLLCLLSQPGPGRTTHLLLAAFGITAPAVACVWSSLDHMHQSSDLWALEQMMITLFLQWPIVIASVLVRWPVVFSAAAKALTDPPPEWQGPDAARTSVEPNGDFWDV